MTSPIRRQLKLAVSAIAEAARVAANELANAVDRGRQARIEAELDRKQDELRHTILKLAEAIGVEAHEARKAMIHESFLASGRVPDSTPKSGS